MRKDERRIQFVEMALSAQRLYDGISELDILASFRERDGLEVTARRLMDRAASVIRENADTVLFSRAA